MWVSGCRGDYAETPKDRLVGTWSLSEVNGLGTCDIGSGDIEVLQDVDRTMYGEFWWKADCGDVGTIDDLLAIVDVIIDESGSQYQIDLETDADPPEIREWDCVLSGPDLDCTELVGDEPILFGFVRLPD